MPAPTIQTSFTREELPGLYAEVLAQNPLLGRIEETLRTLGWSESEIRTAQLLAACRSNGSLTQRLAEMERALTRPRR